MAFQISHHYSCNNRLYSPVRLHFCNCFKNKDLFHQVLLTPQVPNFWDIIVSVIRTQSTVVPDCVFISTMGWEIREKLFNKLLSPSSIELEILGEPSLPLFCDCSFLKVKELHNWKFSLCFVHSHHKTSTANETTLKWQPDILACLVLAEGDRRPKKRCLLLALQHSCSEQFTNNFCAMNSKFHLEFHFKMQVTITHILSKHERSWLGVHIDQSCVPLPRETAFSSFRASPSSTSFLWSPYLHRPKCWTAKLKQNVEVQL